ncbi:hypothetical protein BKA93DRAFT_456871 [Sparassis latifolia]
MAILLPVHSGSSSYAEYNPATPSSLRVASTPRSFGVATASTVAPRYGTRAVAGSKRKAVSDEDWEDEQGVQKRPKVEPDVQDPLPRFEALLSSRGSSKDAWASTEDATQIAENMHPQEENAERSAGVADNHVNFGISDEGEELQDWVQSFLEVPEVCAILLESRSSLPNDLFEETPVDPCLLSSMPDEVEQFFLDACEESTPPELVAPQVVRPHPRQPRGGFEFPTPLWKQACQARANIMLDIFGAASLCHEAASEAAAGSSSPQVCSHQWWEAQDDYPVDAKNEGGEKDAPYESSDDDETTQDESSTEDSTEDENGSEDSTDDEGDEDSTDAQQAQIDTPLDFAPDVTVSDDGNTAFDEDTAFADDHTTFDEEETSSVLPSVSVSLDQSSESFSVFDSLVQVYTARCRLPPLSMIPLPQLREYPEVVLRGTAHNIEKEPL